MPIAWTYARIFSNTQYGHLMPPEDALAWRGSAFAVADGITRDPPSPKDYRGKTIEEMLRRYPNPSGARFAAEVFCETFVRVMARRNARAEHVRAAFLRSNAAIARLNREHIPRPNYLDRDLWGCVAAGGIVHGSTLHWGAIGDCEIAVASERLRFRSGDGMRTFTRFERAHLQRRGYDWSLPEYRVRVRREFRNNPNARWRGRRIGYGALTGERAAEVFMQFGSFRLSRGDTIVAYTDGFTPFTVHRTFLTMVKADDPVLLDQHLTPWSLALARRDPERYGKERTIVITRYA